MAFTCEQVFFRMLFSPVWKAWNMANLLSLKNKKHLLNLVRLLSVTIQDGNAPNSHFCKVSKAISFTWHLDFNNANVKATTILCLSFFILGQHFFITKPTTWALLSACHLLGTFPPPSCGYLTVRSLLHVKLSKPTRDALIGSGVGLVHQVGLIMQIPASSSLAGVKAVILMIKEQ